MHSVESFTGNLDGTMDGLRLPSLAAYRQNVHGIHPHLRLISTPAPSAEAAATFADGSLDLVFVDGCHETEAVIHDIELWLPKLRPGGVIAGDDYTWPSVRSAVHQVFGSQLEGHGAIWCCRDLREARSRMVSR